MTAGRKGNGEQKCVKSEVKFVFKNNFPDNTQHQLIRTKKFKGYLSDNPHIIHRKTRYVEFEIVLRCPLKVNENADMIITMSLAFVSQIDLCRCYMLNKYFWEFNNFLFVFFPAISRHLLYHYSKHH